MSSLPPRRRPVEELDRVESPQGVLTLRRRLEPAIDGDVYEVKLDDEFLMSSLFVDGEVALATLGLDAHAGDDLHVIVGGLGLGYTAVAALDDPRVVSLEVVEYSPAVIDWHRRGLVPAAAALDDDRVTLRQGDVFDLVRTGTFAAAGTVDLVLIDVDHTPTHHLHPSHADFYTAEGLRHLREVLAPGGVFALWSDEPPEPWFDGHLAEVFDWTDGKEVTFRNPLTGGTSSNGVHLAGVAAG